jgi:hypothetical protein
MCARVFVCVCVRVCVCERVCERACVCVKSRHTIETILGLSRFSIYLRKARLRAHIELLAHLCGRPRNRRIGIWCAGKHGR